MTHNYRVVYAPISKNFFLQLHSCIFFQVSKVPQDGHAQGGREAGPGEGGQAEVQEGHGHAVRPCADIQEGHLGR